MPHPPLVTERFEGLQAAAGLDRPLAYLAVVDAVEGQQVDFLRGEPFAGFLEAGQELLARFRRSDLGLQDDPVAGQLGQDQADLIFARAVPAGGFDVYHAGLDGAVQAGGEVGLLVVGDLVGFVGLPGRLESHPAGGQNGHVQFGLAKASILHGTPQGCRIMLSISRARPR